MVLRAGRRTTIQENEALVKAIAPDIYAKLAENLKGIHHYKKMMAESEANLARLHRYFKDFVASGNYEGAIGIETDIKPGFKTPDIGALIKAYILSPSLSCFTFNPLMLFTVLFSRYRKGLHWLSGELSQRHDRTIT